ncbi:hypothetical protein, partial [Rhizobium sp. AG207R]|uniref:hypothetical protein n=1 Tax=Rhizobium sp. AG207R TaxID=2802287 RepID=UPI0022AC73E8
GIIIIGLGVSDDRTQNICTRGRARNEGSHILSDTLAVACRHLIVLLMKQDQRCSEKQGDNKRRRVAYQAAPLSAFDVAE